MYSRRVGGSLGANISHFKHSTPLEINSQCKILALNSKNDQLKSLDHFLQVSMFNTVFRCIKQMKLELFLLQLLVAKISGDSPIYYFVHFFNFPSNSTLRSWYTLYILYIFVAGDIWLFENFRTAQLKNLHVLLHLELNTRT